MDKNDERYATYMTHKFEVTGTDVTMQYFNFISQVIDRGIANGADEQLLAALVVAKANYEGAYIKKVINNE